MLMSMSVVDLCSTYGLIVKAPNAHDHGVKRSAKEYRILIFMQSIIIINYSHFSDSFAGNLPYLFRFTVYKISRSQ